MGIVKDVPETHKNLTCLLRNFSLKKFGFLLGDLKIVRMAYGMQSCSAKFSCPWCHGTAPFEGKDYKLRTCKTLKINLKKYQDLVAKFGPKKALKLAKTCKNVVRENLVECDCEGDDCECEILEKSPPDELHVVLGIINHTFDSLEAAVVEDINNGDRNSGHLHKRVYHWAESESLVGLKYRLIFIKGSNSSINQSKI